MTKPDRIPCCVSFCRRTGSAEKLELEAGAQIICGKCWRHISPPTRSRYRQLARRQRRLLAKFEREIAQHERSGRPMADRRQRQWAMVRERLFDLMARNWARCRREATERKGGIA